MLPGDQGARQRFTTELYDADAMTRTGAFAWERGSLNRPAIIARAGEVASSRAGRDGCSPGLRQRPVKAGVAYPHCACPESL